MGCAHSKTNKKTQKKAEDKPTVRVIQNISESSEESVADVVKATHDEVARDSTASKNECPVEKVDKQEKQQKHEVVFHEEQIPAKAVESFYVADNFNAPEKPCLPPLDETQKKEREEIKLQEKQKRKNEERKRRQQAREAKVPIPVMNWDNDADTEYFKMKCRQRQERRDRATKELKPDDDTLYEVPTRMPEKDYTRDQPVV